MKITLDESVFIKNTESLHEAESPWDKIEKTYGDQLDVTNDKLKKDRKVADPNSTWGKITRAYGDQLDLDESKSMNPWDKLVAFYGDALKENKLEEDTIKQDGKWVNKGKEGTHGTFRTKKEADAQRKAMFAQGYKEGLNEMLDKYHFYDVQEFEAGTPERSRLELVASILTKESGKGRKYEVKDTWMDYGSQLAWTTIIYTDPDDNYGVQILSPKEWADLLNAENDDEINQVIDQITSSEYWSDTKVEQPDQEVDVESEITESLNESISEDDKNVILDAVKGEFETGHGYLEDKRDFEEMLDRRLSDKKFDELFEYYSELQDLGPSGFYEEYKDVLDFDPDFISEYGDTDGEGTFFDSGREFKIVETHDTKDVDGYELSIVHVEDVDDGTDWFYVLLDGEVEWGPEDTYEGAKSWYDTVNDGYYVDDEPAWDNHDDDVDFDDNYSEEDLKALFGKVESCSKSGECEEGLITNVLSKIPVVNKVSDFLFGDDNKVESLDKSDECEEGLVTNVLSKIPIVNKVSDFLFGEDIDSNTKNDMSLKEEQKGFNPAANEIKSDPAFNDYDDEW